MNFLERIARRKRSEVLSLDEPEDVVPCERSFVAGLRRRMPCLIAEIKPHSPSEGALIDPRNAPGIVAIYNRYAQAISVLCDEADFGGGYDLLRELRECTDLPIIAKDFVIDVVQVKLARAAGADAILLIASILDEREIEYLSLCAMEMGMAVVFEVHHGTELGKIPSLSPEQMVIGVNNRDLRTLAIDMNMTESLSLNIREGFPDHLLLSESGIRGEEDINRLAESCDGFLIGSTFLRSENIERAVSALFPPTSADLS